MSIEVILPKKFSIPDDIAKRIDQYLNKMKATIMKDTLAGRDLNGSPFEGYSAAYQAFKSGLTGTGKKRKGTTKRRSGKVSRGGVVNLWYSGGMMNSMQTELKNEGGLGIEGILKFDSREQADKAKAHNRGERGLPKRRFFGITAKNRQDIINIIKEAFKRGRRK